MLDVIRSLLKLHLLITICLLFANANDHHPTIRLPTEYMMYGGGGHKCPRCDKRVYFAEEIIAMSKHWHKSCFRCVNSECGRSLDSRNCCDHNGEAYCSTCYKRQFGPKGYGFGGGSGTLSMDQLDSNAHKPVSVYTKELCVADAVSDSSLSPGSTSPKSTGSSGMGLTSYRPYTNPALSRTYANNDKCNRCSKTVYLAEKMMAGGAAWHKMCFSCAQCKTRLQSTNLCEKESEIYCKTCYGRNFGPKGYGYGVGAGTLQMQQ